MLKSFLGLVWCLNLYIRRLTNWELWCWQAIEKVKTDKTDKPYQDVKILNVTVPKSWRSLVCMADGVSHINTDDTLLKKFQTEWFQVSSFSLIGGLWTEAIILKKDCRCFSCIHFRHSSIFIRLMAQAYLGCWLLCSALPV